MTASVTRQVTLITTSAVLVLLCAGSLCYAGGSESGYDPRVEIGFEIATKQGISLDHDVAAQGLGSYLTNAMGCNDCHTWPNYAQGGDPYSREAKQLPLTSYLAGGRAFVLPTETVCSRNITPAPNTNKPAGLSRSTFLYVLRTGCDPQDANFRDPQMCELLQVMPWPNYQDMKNSDLVAIYAYLSALPHEDPVGDAAGGGCFPDPQGVAGE